MGRGGIRKQFKELGFKPSTLFVFLCLQDEARSNEDGRAVAGREWLAEELDLTEKVIRNALNELQQAGFIAIAPQKGKRTALMISFPNDRREGQLKGQLKGHLNSPINQNDSDSEGQLKGQLKGQTGVTAVRRSSDVDVVDVGLTEDLGKPRATPPFVHKTKTAMQARYEAASKKAPNISDVVMHVDRLFSDLSKGHKYPWAGQPDASSTLAALIVTHGAPLVMAAAEKFFIRGNSWNEERGWAIDEFGKQFGKLIALDGSTKRAAHIAAELKERTLPSTPKEIKTQQAIAHRRQQEPIDDYDPSEVRFREDMLKHSAKTAAGVSG